MPQEMLKGTTTRSPRRRFFTEEPISSTVPVNSCPNVQPTRVSGTSPWSRCRSEPQIALRVTLRMASLECSIRGSGLRTTLTLFGQSQRHCIAARLDGQGREVWASTLAGDGESACRAVAFDERTGDIWAAGEFTGTVGPTRAAGLTDAFVVRISGVTGEIRLVHTFGGKGAEHATALALTDAGDVIVAGTFGRDGCAWRRASCGGGATGGEGRRRGGRRRGWGWVGGGWGRGAGGVVGWGGWGMWRDAPRRVWARVRATTTDSSAREKTRRAPA